MLGHFIGWAFANIAIPYAAPVVFIKAIQALQLDLKPEAKERIRITYLLREGQYAMGSVAIATTAMFELFTADHLLSTPAGVTALILLICMTIFNTLIFVLGVSFGGPSVPDNVRIGMTTWGWLKTYRLGASSLVLAAGVSICAFWSHWMTYEIDHAVSQPQESAHNATDPPQTGGCNAQPTTGESMSLMQLRRATSKAMRDEDGFTAAIWKAAVVLSVVSSVLVTVLVAIQR